MGGISSPRQIRCKPACLIQKGYWAAGFSCRPPYSFVDFHGSSHRPHIVSLTFMDFRTDLHTVLLVFTNVRTDFHIVSLTFMDFRTDLRTTSLMFIGFRTDLHIVSLIFMNFRTDLQIAYMKILWNHNNYSHTRLGTNPKATPQAQTQPHAPTYI